MKFHFSSLGSWILKYSVTGAVLPSLVMEKVNFSSRGNPIASDPFLG